MGADPPGAHPEAGAVPSPVMTLWDIWNEHRGRGAIKLDSFPAVQDRLLTRFRGQAIRMLEIGVFAGGSLEIWQDYLGPAATIVGVDITAIAVENAPGFDVHIGDQADPDFLRRVAAESGPFDVVIDDGGHQMHQQIASFESLYPLLNDDGLYVVEDTCTSYWDEFGAGMGVPTTFIEYAKAKIDELNADFVNDPAFSATAFTRSTTTISFHQGLVAFEKHRNERPRYLVHDGREITRRGMRYGTGYAD